MKLGRDYKLYDELGVRWKPTDYNRKPMTCWFVWNGRSHTIDLRKLRFPIVITKSGFIREADGGDYYRRIKLTFLGKWKRKYEIGDKSRNKPWLFELTHSIKNLIVEYRRSAGIDNRKNKPWYEPAGFDWYELHKDNNK